ncbi:MAG TPA: hypothetical protein VGF17_25905 [Phytomonospora sp.]
MAGGGDHGFPYAAVARLHAIAIDEWPAIDGYAAAQGVDPFALPPHRFCNFVYAWAIERVTEREKFLTLLYAPIPGRAPSTVSAERQTQDLRELASWAAGVQGGR